MVTFYGSHICGGCREAKELFAQKGFADFQFVEITESTDNLRAFLQLRDHREELRQARADAEEKGARLSELEKQTAEQQEKLRRAEPAAQAYETLKDRTAGVELEAHRRAQVIENEAQAKAKETLQKLEQLVEECRALSGPKPPQPLPLDGEE